MCSDYFINSRGFASAIERSQSDEGGNETNEAALCVVGIENKEARIGSERRKPCFGQFS
jgi:hypothetical protein